MTTPGPIGRIQNEQGLTTKVKKNSLHALLSLLDESVENRKKIAAMIEPHSEKFVNALIDLAEGVLIEHKGSTNGKENYLKEVNGVRCYKRPPDPQALGKLLSLLNTDTAQNAAAFMAYSRSLAVVAEIDARIARAKARNLEAQTDFTCKQTDAFERSLVSEEEMTENMLTMAYESLAIFQSESRETLLAASQSDEAFSKWIAHKGDRMKKAMAGALSKSGLILEEDSEEEAA